MTSTLAPRARRLHALAAALALVAVATPAAAQKNRADVLLSDRPSPRPDCRVLDTPRHLPSVAELTDSTGLAQALAAYAAAHPISGEKKMFAVYSLGFNAQGQVERVQPIDYWLPQGYEADLTALVSAAVRPQRGGSPVNLRLRVEPAEQSVVRVGHS
jgi:hypothetical protein